MVPFWIASFLINIFLLGNIAGENLKQVFSLDQEFLPSDSSQALEFLQDSLKEQEIIEQSQKNISLQRNRMLTTTELEPNTEYHFKLLKHAFEFGSALNAHVLLKNKSEIAKIYPSREKLIENFDNHYRQSYLTEFDNFFNAGVTENAFKWTFMNRTAVTDWSLTDGINRFLKKKPELQKNFRGHCIFWNRTKRLPLYLQEASQEKIKKELLGKRLQVIRRYPNILEWDLINEPLAKKANTEESQKKNQVVFDWREDFDLFVDLFKKAKQINPQARFYLNEYGLLDGESTTEFIELANNLLKAGTPLDGIGIQGHLTERNFASLANAEKNLDRLSSLGLDIKITEFDLSDKTCQAKLGNQTERANYTQKMLTLFFGTPAVKGIYFWGFIDSCHWRGEENAGLLKENFTPNETGQMFLDLIKKEWSTDLQIVSNEKGGIGFLGFPGQYQVTNVATGKMKIITLE